LELCFISFFLSSFVFVSIYVWFCLGGCWLKWWFWMDLFSVIWKKGKGLRSFFVENFSLWYFRVVFCYFFSSKNLLLSSEILIPIYRINCQVLGPMDDCVFGFGRRISFAKLKNESDCSFS
jgi:hypothetical protein